MADVELTIIGGGIVGCALADAAARAGLATVLLEKEAALARGTTSRNSEVAHGGMYYPEGSLKAALCVRGRRLLAEFARQAGLGYRECGKLIVAVDEEERGTLESVLRRGQANGVEDFRALEAGELQRLEPGVAGVAALLSPRTAICDAEGLTKALAARAVEHGARVLTGATVTELEARRGAWRVTVGQGARREGWTHGSALVANAAGLFADPVAAMGGRDIDGLGWRQVLVKGNYFVIDPRHGGRVGRLVYPVPPADGSTLGTHLCLDLGGRLRLGPDMEGPLPAGTDPGAVDYGVDAARRDDFHAAAKGFLPWLEAADLTPDLSGLRPKLAADGFRDFVIDMGEGDGFVNLVGIDSPGLTSAMAIAEHVVGRLQGT